MSLRVMSGGRGAESCRRERLVSKKDREKVKKAKEKKAKALRAKVLAKAKAKNAPPEDRKQTFGTDSFGPGGFSRSSLGGGSPRMPRRSKKG